MSYTTEDITILMPLRKKETLLFALDFFPELHLSTLPSWARSFFMTVVTLGMSDSISYVKDGKLYIPNAPSVPVLGEYMGVTKGGIYSYLQKTSKSPELKEWFEWKKEDNEYHFIVKMPQKKP